MPRGGRERLSSARRLFALVLCALLVALGAFAPTSTFAEDDLSISSPPEHHKTITDNGDGTYDVTLTVKGEEKDKVTQTTGKADVVIVFDRSNSMNAKMSETDSRTRMQVAKDATNALINQLIGPNSEADVQVAFVDFDANARYAYNSNFSSVGSNHPTWYNKTNETNASMLTSVVDMEEAYPNTGATNWELGLTEANVILNDTSGGARSDADKYIVFISDGNPTLRETNPEGTVVDEDGIFYAMVNYVDIQLTDPSWGTWTSSSQIQSETNSNGGTDYYVVDQHDSTKTHTLYTWNSDRTYTYYRYDYDFDHPANNPEDAKVTTSTHADVLVTQDPFTFFGTGSNAHKGTANTDAYGYNYAVAKTVAANRPDGTTLYCVYTAPEANKMDDLATDAEVNTESKPALALDGTTPENLTSAFSQIAGQITTKVSRSYTEVTISDKLSQWADFRLQDNVEKVTCTVNHSDGTSTTLTDDEVAQQVTIDYENETVSWNVANGGELEKDATYSITFTIWPNQDAFDRAADIENGKDTADSGTNWTGTAVEETTGIYSNDFGSKTVYENGSTASTTTENTYVTWKQYTTTTVNGVEQPSETTGPWYNGYEHPTMNPPTSTIQVTKVWDDDIDSSHRPDSISFTLYQDGNVMKDSSGNNVTLTLTSANVDPNDSNKWTGTFSIAVPAGPDGHTYSVQEDTETNQLWLYYNPNYGYEVISSPAYDYETSVSHVVTSGDTETGVMLQGRQTQAGGATVTNKACAMSLTVVKKGATAGSSTDWNLPGAKFKLSKATIGDDGKITVGSQVGSVMESGNDGTISFGSVLIANSDYFLEETDAPDGYLTAGPYVIRMEWVGSDQAPVLYKVTEQSDGTTTTYTLGDRVGVLEEIDNERMDRTMTVTDYTIPPLPHSGVPGNFPLLFSGLILLGLSLRIARHQLDNGRGGVSARDTDIAASSAAPQRTGRMRSRSCRYPKGF